MPDDDLSSRVARLALSSGEREQAKSGRLRRDADACGFTGWFRDLQKRAGGGVRILYFRGHADTFGTRPPMGVPFSDPPPEPLGRKRK
jgi:hypothetical protein